MRMPMIQTLSSVLLASCAATPESPPAAAPVPTLLPAEIERYRTDRAALRSFYDIDGSAVRLERLDAFDRGWLERLDEIDFDALDVAGRVDWLLLRTEVEYGLDQRAMERARRAGLATLLPFEEAVGALERARWEVAPLDAREAAATLAQIAEQAGDVKERARREAGDGGGEGSDEDALVLGAVEARRVAGWVSDLRGTLGTWYRHHDAFDPGFAWWCEEPYDAAREALDALAKHLREDVAGLKGEDDDPLVGDPIGRAALELDLAHEWLASSPEELIAVGEAELAWCDARLVEAAGDLGFGDDWRAALEHVKALHVEPGAQDELVAAQAREAIAFLKERDLVTIPPLCEETWRVRMLDERGQRTLPFAAYGGQKMLVAFPTRGMDHDSKLMSLRGNNIHFTRCVTPHELIPGHHLQGFMARRHATHRGLFRTPFLVEGWALYWEMVEWDEGWAKTPEDRIGMLFWRKHRAARIVVSLEFHLGEMAPQEMIEFLVERVGHERDNATSEVRRYVGDGYSPLYQCGYMIGGLQLRALARELVESGEMTPREFHDGILHLGPIPIELIRASLLGHELGRDARATWNPALGS